MTCRHCNNNLTIEFVDLNNSPAANSYLSKEELTNPEIFYPLKVFVCEKCFLVQIEEHKKSHDIFNSNYAYFSSYSKEWLSHVKKYVNMITQKQNLTSNSFVIEIASNDGYLLQYFKKQDIPCLGIEPTTNTAKVAKEKGINVIEEFFTSKIASDIKKADLVLGNNVLAHVPNINDFVKGLKIILKKEGIITLEFPHLLNLINEKQFDTIYHEHFSYLSLYTVKTIFEKQNLIIFDVEELPTHGGSLRIYACHKEKKELTITNNVAHLLMKEKEHNLFDLKTYKNFQLKINKIKYELLNFLISCKKTNKKIVAYGAAAKGNTLLNYSGIKKDLLNFVVDKSPHKIGKFLPASHIPIVEEKEISNLKPDYILILPWNIKDEITEQLNYVKKWNCRFVIAIPRLEVL